MVFSTGSLYSTSFGQMEKTFIFGWIVDGTQMSHFWLLGCRDYKLASLRTRYVSRHSILVAWLNCQQAAISGRLEHLHDYTKAGEEAVMSFPTPPPLIAVAQILYAVTTESQGYKLTKVCVITSFSFVMCS